MLKKMRICFLLLLIFGKTALTQEQKPEIYNGVRNVGDIPFDPSLDKKDFFLCDSQHVFQYYNLNLSLVPGSGFYDGRKAQKEYFIKLFKKVKDSTSEKYFVTIRFIVNCRGQADRFRATVINAQYKPFKKYNRDVVKQLIQLASNDRLWKPAQYNGAPCDYYYYITFTLLNGEIINLAP